MGMAAFAGQGSELESCVQKLISLTIVGMFVVVIPQGHVLQRDRYWGSPALIL